MSTGVVVLAHGSRGERGKPAIEEALQRIAAGLGQLLADGVEITGASFQFNHPTAEEAVALLAAKGVNRIVIAPYFLFPGRHITEDIPQLIEGFRQTYPGASFLLADNLGLDNSFIGLLAKRIREAAPDIAPRSRAILTSPIERESLQIIEHRLPRDLALSEDENTIVRRIVHACGDIAVARLIRFSQSAVASGASAVRRGSPIFTDVRMVATGISDYLAVPFGCSVSCALDWANGWHGQGTTRTASAMAQLGARLTDSIVAIGNAPTALIALLDLVDNGEIRPALVVGMPVGFVQAAESKQELMKRDIPYVTVAGTRGGSAIAAATVNALLRIVAEKCNREKD